MNTIFDRFKCLCISLFIVLAVATHVSAQSPTDQSQTATNSTTDQIAALQLQLTNAWHQVGTIVNKPVTAYRRDPGYRVSVYGPGGWFHPGASTPDFSTVDVRKSQEFAYTNPWVSSDITSNMMFRGSDLEFNANTKLFYTNRDLPKRRLTEAEMVQINALYRTIGHCQSAIAQLQPPPPAPVTDTAADSSDTETDSNAVTPAPAIAALERVPKQTRMLYGSIAIGTLLVLVIAARLLKKKPD